MRIILVMSIAAAALAADGPQIGTINGQPIFGKNPQRTIDSFISKHGKPPASSADQQELASIAAQDNCNIVRDKVSQVAEAGLKTRYAIAVSPEEVAVSKQYWQTHDPNAELQQSQTQYTTWSQAATDLYEKNQGPEAVYQAVIKPFDSSRGVPEQASRLAYQANLVRWRDPAVRAKLASSAVHWNKTTVADRKKGQDRADQLLLEKRKLEDAIDNQLAAQDPQFRSDLAQLRQTRAAQYNNPWLERPGSDYMKQKRGEFWQAHYAQQQVTLNDPKLADQCQLGSTLGVKVAQK
jgi:hypothetical protein